MDTRAFFDRVLPPTGGVYFANHGTKGLRQLPPMESLDLLTQKVFEHGVKKENVYFAVGVYQGSRTQEDARDKKALYLDLDCGEGKPFPTKASSVRALKQFCESSGFPLPNIVVDSGHGIHCYWTFERTVPIEQWNPMAAAFKQMCVDYEFHADPAITADSARIMRVPGTYNYKDPSHPIPCRILKADPTDFDPDALKTVLNAGFNKVADALTGEIKDDLSAGLYGERTYHAGDMIEQCAALRHTRDTGGKDQAGMLWHKILHLLAFTEDGQDYIHPVSNKHESYSATATEQRFAYAKARKETVGPTLCKTIEGFLPSKCESCPFRGNIKTPLVLGKSQDSFLPHGWKMTKEGCFKPTKFNEKGQAEDWVRAIPYMFSDVELYSTRIGNGLQLTAHNGPKMHSAMILGVDLVGDTRELSKNLMIDNIMMTDAEMQEFRRIMIPWMRKMEMVRNAKAAPLAGLGWMKSDELVGFARGRYGSPGVWYRQDAGQGLHANW
jgi:hypothetical protein